MTKMTIDTIEWRVSKLTVFLKKRTCFLTKKIPFFSKKDPVFFKKRTKFFVKKIQILKVGFKVKFIYLCNLALKILDFLKKNLIFTNNNYIFVYYCF